MPHVIQMAMPFLPARRNHTPIIRQRRRPFTRPTQTGPYRLPEPVADRLGRLLAGFRNGETAFRLVILIARYWSSPNRVGMPFPIDRRALANHPELGLSESQIRGAIRTLERVGFIERNMTGKGSKYRTKGDDLYRRPILFQFGAEFRDAFEKANRRRVRTSTNHDRRTITPWQHGFRTKSPKDKGRGVRVLMGQVRKGAFEKEVGSVALDSDSRLEAAILRWKNALMGDGSA